MRVSIACASIVAVWLGALGHAETARTTTSLVEKMSVCALQRVPVSYDRKLIEVSGIVSHGLEDFTLSDPECAQPPAIWLEYGGRMNSETVYCCGVSAGAPREGMLVVEGLAIPLMDDALFRRFDARVRGGGDVRFRAHLIGRFFAGVKQQSARGAPWGGYGHLGCCSLLVIQQVVGLESM